MSASFGRCTIRPAITALGSLFLCICAGLAVADELRFDFEQDREGEPPAGFIFARTGRGGDGRWVVVGEPEAKALAQVDKTRNEGRLTLAVVRDSDLRDVRLSVRLRVVSGQLEETGGIVWRYKDKENYLLARLDVRDHRVRLYRVVNGNLTRFGSEEVPRLKEGTWYELRVEHRGDRIKVYLNGEAMIVERDRHFRESGKVGLWTKADTETQFDDFRVDKLADEDRDE